MQELVFSIVSQAWKLLFASLFFGNAGAVRGAMRFVHGILQMFIEL